MQYINFLSQFNQALNIEDSKIPPSFSLDKALIEAVRLAKPGTLIVIISDFLHFNQETEKALKALSRHNELLFIRSYDPLEEELPPPGLHPVSDGQQTLLINSNSAQVRSDYSAWATQHKNQLEEMSKRFKSLLINLSTHQETSHCLQEILRNYSR
ncbi:hypothetical protein A3729_24260 [Oleiphilus sp. HI0043]|nr:hypothetical protein A3729_24260 [Oleiphilus sp. HI0043]